MRLHQSVNMLFVFTNTKLNIQLHEDFWEICGLYRQNPFVHGVYQQAITNN